MPLLLCFPTHKDGKGRISSRIASAFCMQRDGFQALRVGLMGYLDGMGRDGCQENTGIILLCGL